MTDLLRKSMERFIDACSEAGLYGRCERHRFREVLRAWARVERLCELRPDDRSWCVRLEGDFGRYRHMNVDNLSALHSSRAFHTAPASRHWAANAGAGAVRIRL